MAQYRPIDRVIPNNKVPSLVPTRIMKETSIYLDDVDRERLSRLAEREGKSRAHVVREALALYDSSRPDRNFEILKMTLDPGTPGIPRFDDPRDFQDWLDTEGLKATGEDAWETPPR